MKIINIEKEPQIYFLFDKNKLVYIGETKVENGKRINQHKDKKFDKAKCISSKKLSFLNNEYFRKYYELRLINRFKPKYNKEKTKAPSLNNFICKIFLFNENPNPQFITPLTTYNQIIYKGKYNKFLEYKNKRRNKKCLNQYTKVWDNLDINKKLYINNQNAFKFLVNETMKLPKNLSIKFTPRIEKIHN
tara:strand:- start:51 stop:620 length:570 start_codon:yes stop_codon:yes gene_type:complete